MRSVRWIVRWVAGSLENPLNVGAWGCSTTGCARKIARDPAPSSARTCSPIVSGANTWCVVLYLLPSITTKYGGRKTLSRHMKLRVAEIVPQGCGLWNGDHRV